jgi:acetyl-CoA carboxylase, biotin carboxylase subunit
MLSTVLIANRGEIAVRVIRACHELGIRAIGVYSTEDRDSEAVRLADEAVCIGPGPARRSYLNIPAVIEAAKRTGATAIHPGYGFLSENPDFAEVCEANDLTFIGPPTGVMQQLGDKTSARQLMADAGLPMLPGSLRPLQEDAARRCAAEIGYPVVIKAAMGRGGRGVQPVLEPAEFSRRYRETRAVARTLLGDSRVYLERYLTSARHVEVQVLCDHHGEVRHLGERDCSVQRRNQKIIEEAPAPVLPRSLVEEMCEAAVRGARAARYVGAGTFEFLVDANSLNYYFMEINCRIQVEHPVTEMVTGCDLVAEQLLIAGGEHIEARGDGFETKGAAIECRINLEDPDRDFRPAPGLLTEFRPPGGPFVRVDTHGFAGYRASPAYDSLLAKLVVWAPERAIALSRMSRALSEFRISGPGVRTNADFLNSVVHDPVFREARHDTSLVGKMLSGT